MEKSIDVYGIGNPLMDLLVQIDDEFLKEIGVNKGIMHLIDTERRELLLKKIPEPKIAPGGSCANTMMHLADFGLSVIYSGGIGSDNIGKDFNKGMIDRGCQVENPIKSLPTGTSIVLITPDAERTQNTYLGACQEFEQTDVNLEAISKSRFLYFTGYMWDTQNQKEALNLAIKTAIENETKIIFDVADPFAVGRSKEDFLEIIENHVDYILANTEEAKMMTEKNEINEMIEFFRHHVKGGAIKDGANGSFIFNKEKIIHIPINKVNAIDTTGAGDIYASGYIYGIARNYELERTGKIASYVASKVVEQIGARLEYTLKKIIDSI